LAEFSTGTEKKAAADQSLMAYQVQNLPSILHGLNESFNKRLSLSVEITNICCSMPWLLPPVISHLLTKSGLALPSIFRSSFMR
jgi:hypothetical protein